MPKHSSNKTDPDVNEIASSIIGHITGEDKPAPNPSKEAPQKNPAAVALGRLGGLKGGHARAAKLSAKKRKQITKKAAQTRWAKKR